MPRLSPLDRPAATPDPRLARLLWQWLALGLLAVLLVPAARGAHPWLGALPFWLLAAPSVALLTLHRHALAAAWSAGLVPRGPRRRRRIAPGRQARRLPPAPRLSRAPRAA